MSLSIRNVHPPNRVKLLGFLTMQCNVFLTRILACHLCKMDNGRCVTLCSSQPEPSPACSFPSGTWPTPPPHSHHLRWQLSWASPTYLPSRNHHQICQCLLLLTHFHYCYPTRFNKSMMNQIIDDTLCDRHNNKRMHSLQTKRA